MPPKRKAASAASEAISNIQAPNTRSTRSKTDASAKKPKLESTPPVLKEGDQLPDDLSPVTNNAGQEVRIQDLVKDSGLLIFFYPRANTPGCTTQACGFRDRYDEVVADGWKIYGMSYDSPKAQTTWKTKYSLPYELLCDPNGDVLKRLGVTKTQSGNGGGVKRSHIVIDKGGRIKSLKIGVSPAQSIAQGVEAMTGKSVPDSAEAQKVETAPTTITNGGETQVSEPTNTVQATDPVPAIADTATIATAKAEITDTPIDTAPPVVDTVPLSTMQTETTETVTDTAPPAAEVTAEAKSNIAADITPTTALPVTAAAEPVQTLPPAPVEPTIPSLEGQTSQVPSIDPIAPAVAPTTDNVSLTKVTEHTNNPLDPMQTASTITTEVTDPVNNNLDQASFASYVPGLQQQL